MMAAGTHRIRRQRWQVKVTSLTSAFELRQSLRTHLEAVLLPAFQRAFDSMNTGNEIWHIPRLTLDLRLSDGDNLFAELVKLIELELPKKLSQELLANPLSEKSHQPNARLIGQELLTGYLSSGRIGWHSARLELSELLPHLRDLAREFVAEPRQTAFLQSVPSIHERMASILRLLQLLDSSTCADLLQRVPEGGIPEVRALRSALRRLIAAKRVGHHLRMRMMALLLVLEPETLDEWVAAPVAALLHELDAHLTGAGFHDIEFRTALDALQRYGQRVSPVPTVVASNSMDALESGTARDKQPSPSGPLDPPPVSGLAPWRSPTEQLSAVRQGISPDPTSGIADLEDHNQITDEPKQADRNTQDRVVQALQAAIATSSGGQLPDASEGVLANDAGLILLHPFLTRLFQNVGIVHQDTRHLDQLQIPRAAALLHWLATGREEPFEFELTLTKVLLGFSPSDPLPVGGGLLDGGDRTEADALLAAAIDHWSALRNTSRDGLRESFLQRTGLLYDGSQGWRLQVETRPFDMLLQQLPWSISVVKLPWMTKPIFTDWPTP